MVMVSPPVAFIEFDSVSTIECVHLIVSGRRDDIPPPEMFRQTYQRCDAAAHFEVIDGADHFYGGYEDKLEEVLLSHIEP